MGATSTVPASSPPRWREHASEAGSPTLEQVDDDHEADDDFFPQVLLMSRRSPRTPDPGYGSLSTSGLATTTSPRPSPFSTPSPSSLASSMQRMTMVDVVGIDVAVAQAAQTLQQLQQQQTALYTGWGGGLYTPQHHYQYHQQQQQKTSPQVLGNLLASVQQSQEPPRDPLALERAARLYRSAASVCDASCTWSGTLPPRSSTAGPNSSYSTKIFLGGVPWDISEQTLVQVVVWSFGYLTHSLFVFRLFLNLVKFVLNGLAETTPVLPEVTCTSSSRYSLFNETR